MKTRRKGSPPRGLLRGRRGTATHNREFLVEYVFRLLVRIGHAERIGADLGKLHAFVDACSTQYPANPYHNWFHASDVTHTAAWLSQRPGIRALLADADIFWLLIAAVVLDLKHPGHGNMWEVK